MSDRKVVDAETHRGLLLSVMEGVSRGEIPVNVANSTATTSKEIHVSQRQQWTGQTYYREE